MGSLIHKLKQFMLLIFGFDDLKYDVFTVVISQPQPNKECLEEQKMGGEFFHNLFKYPISF